ncbi:hypothetical protein FF100_28580 [Methylobacterium terricola]|uniref:Uncharacterized protein n=1 Tax=Methylobacterium terricola TaxID=2583531 RepID=A0A5C4LBA0_9HYPH|nr:hypothetical protein [Methylobacterium terricola]TNC08790.1 hypothetical protein FF100_28580 [Methylobacterium terricola]
MTKRKRGTKKPEQSDDAWTTEPSEGSNGRGPFPPDNSDLRRRIKENPNGLALEAQSKFRKLKAGYRRDLYEVLAMCVGVGRHYSNDYKAWKAFFDQPFFQTGKQKLKARTHHTDALRHTMNYVCDATSKQARSRTGKYAAALHEIMTVGTPVHLVAEEIEQAGGIEKLYEAYLEREALKPKKGRKQIRTEEDYAAAKQYYNLDDKRVSAPKDMILADLEGASFEEPDDVEAGEGEESVMDGGGDEDTEDGEQFDILDDLEFGVTPVVERGRDPAGRRTIELEVNLKQQSRFLNMKEGQKAVIHVICCGTDKEFLRLRARKAVWKRR